MPTVDAKMALLQALISGPSYGLELIEKVATKSKGKIKLAQGSAYMALRQMEAEGLLETYDGEDNVPETRGRPRAYFRITAKGKKAALEDQAMIGGLFDMIPARVRAMVAAAFFPGVSR